MGAQTIFQQHQLSPILIISGLIENIIDCFQGFAVFQLMFLLALLKKQC